MSHSSVKTTWKWKTAAPAAVFLAILATVSPLSAQVGRVDSIATVGNARVSRTDMLSRIQLQPGQAATYLDIQNAERRLWASRDFKDVKVSAAELQTPDGPKVVLTFNVVEQPLVRSLSFRGLEHVSERRVRDSTGLAANVPYSPQTIALVKAFIRGDLAKQGIPFANIEEQLTPTSSGGSGDVVDLVLNVTEGNRVTVADFVVEGNQAIDDETIVAALATRPEAFWWFRPGTYDPDQFERDMQEALPKLYSADGYLDFQILAHELVIDPETGKSRIEMEVSEGPQYRVADLLISGNAYLTRERIENFFQAEEGGLLQTLGIGGGQRNEDLVGGIFDQVAFETALQSIQEAYRNEGYIFARVEPLLEKRPTATPDEPPTVTIGVDITEGTPAIVGRVDILGNDYTHEWVIRDRIFMLPGDTYSQARLLESYQSIGSLGFFEMPLPPPDIDPDETTGLVNITFHVKEAQTATFQFGSSVGGGTGLAGYIGLDHTNLFGQAKEGHLRWDFGRYLNNFSISYSDPALLRSLVSSTVSLFNSTDRFIQFQNGRRRRVGASLRFGFPIPGDVRSRLFIGYALSRTKLTLREGVEDVSLFGQPDGVQSQIQLGVTRNTLNHPLFPTVGSRLSWNVDLNGGILGGNGDFTKHMLEGTWWVPVGTLGGDPAAGTGVRFALGVSLRGGAIFGDASRFPFDRFWMGGVQFGQQVRGYDETSITPLGYFPEQSAAVGDAQRLGDAFVSMSAEYAMRLSNMLSASAFFDAGNIWREPRDIDPTRLFRGAGVGLQIVTPFGPIGVDYAYGFDKTIPGWQLHFRMGPGY
jgi:outer membrane protein insertion porin family